MICQFHIHLNDLLFFRSNTISLLHALPHSTSKSREYFVVRRKKNFSKKSQCVMFVKFVAYQSLICYLSIDRLALFVTPFSCCHLGYYGPIMVSNGKCLENCWIAHFTCLNIHAMHIEIANDLYTDSYLNFVGANHIGGRFQLVIDSSDV